jgi:precorrin-6A/cobalt-precorrin-6A reductase
MSVLILGGTAEARELARLLVTDGLPVVSSLAGRVAAPALPEGDVRIGGFGGPLGLQDYLTEHRISAVVDATHPFAAQMSRHAAEATRAARTPLLRLARPGWGAHPRAEEWTWLPNLHEAAETIRGQRPFLTTGRQSLPAFLPWSDRDALVRVVDAPTVELPSRWRLIRSRGPYRYEAERELLLEHRVDVLVTKDSGGDHTRPKLDAAADLGVPVVVISRPATPPGVPEVTTSAEVQSWLRGLRSS